MNDDPGARRAPYIAVVGPAEPDADTYAVAVEAGRLIAERGAALGALAVQQLDPSFLKRVIPVLLIAVAIYTLLKPALGIGMTVGLVIFQILFVVNVGRVLVSSGLQ